MNFVTSQNLAVNSTMSPLQNIHKHTQTSPDGKTHNQIDHILIDRRWHSSVLDVQSFSGADCDTGHCLVVAKFTERLAVNKQVTQKFDWERLNLRKLNELKFRKPYQIEITNWLGALVNQTDGEDINWAWENIKDDIKTSTEESLGLYELKRHKAWFYEECLGFLEQRKQAKMQWVQDTS